MKGWKEAAVLLVLVLALAGILLVREAGGEVTRLDGSPCALTQTDILATNGKVHAAALRALKQKQV